MLQFSLLVLVMLYWTNIRFYQFIVNYLQLHVDLFICWYPCRVLAITTLVRQWTSNAVCANTTLVTYGVDETKNTALHPWGVFAFVVGFEQECVEHGVGMRGEFATLWSYLVSRDISAEALYAGGKDIADEWISRGYRLTMVKCGKYK
jgi:hypothetical protein